MTYLIDTAAAVEKIEQSGLSRKQAEAIVSTIAETGDLVATKSDIDHLETTIKSDIDRLETATKSDIHQLETTIKSDIHQLETAIKNLGENMKTQITLRALAVGGIMVALLKALEYLGV